MGLVGELTGLSASKKPFQLEWLLRDKCAASEIAACHTCPQWIHLATRRDDCYRARRRFVEVSIHTRRESSCLRHGGPCFS
jgi:hypothetical protein